jgi:AcrR family transcriptional regulator
MVDAKVGMDSRAAIVLAGREFFGSRGYAHTSLVDVARAAHVTKGAVYHHFGSKKGLFRAVYEAVELEAQMRARSEIDLGAPPVVLIQQVVAAHLDTVLDPIVQQVALIDAPAVLGPHYMGPIEEQRAFQDFRGFVQAGIDAGELRDVDADAITRVIRGACVQAALYIAHAEDKISARRRIGDALQVLIGGLATSVPLA